MKKYISLIVGALCMALSMFAAADPIQMSVSEPPGFVIDIVPVPEMAMVAATAEAVQTTKTYGGLKSIDSFSILMLSLGVAMVALGSAALFRQKRKPEGVFDINATMEKLTALMRRLRHEVGWQGSLTH
jgi:hypothetical protein